MFFSTKTQFLLKYYHKNKVIDFFKICFINTLNFKSCTRCIQWTKHWISLTASAKCKTGLSLTLTVHKFCYVCRLLSPGGTGCSRHPTTSRTSRLCVRHWCLQKPTKDKSQTFRRLFPLSCQNSNRILMTPLKRFSQLVHPYGKFLSERKSFIAVCSISLACFWCIS